MDDSGLEVEGDEDWRYGPLGRAGARGSGSEAQAAAASPSFDEEDEDWRYGPLGRAGALKDEEELEDPEDPIPLTKGSAAEERTSRSAEPLRQEEVQPRTIWAYWAQGHEQMPAFFRMCVDTWQRVNPHWDVRILQKSTVMEYLTEDELPNRFMDMTSHQTASDAVRLGILCRYGGIWMDVNILVCGSLDKLCWNAISWGQRPACVFYHPSYGTDALGGKDFVESWFLATAPGNPFFIRWRDIFKELFHDRLDIEGLLGHRFYQGLDLSGFEKLNNDFSGSGMEFREYLAIHAMCHRLLETEPEARRLWRDQFIQVNAADTAFRLQMVAQASNLHMAQVLLLEDGRAGQLIEGVPLIKFRTPDYGPLLQLSAAQLKDKKHLLGRLLDPPDAAEAMRRPATTRAAFSSVPRLGGRRHLVTASLAAVMCRGMAVFPMSPGQFAGSPVRRHAPESPLPLPRLLVPACGRR
ncbi:FCK3 [Symbiodinium natans]|uniref:FCK3 protein n=1 Tax=Symbiodinium natans TaxID=878477 RepID=A0A812N6Y5_9DINO|nr:FCK3 [Symbiodinium natans]